MIIIVTTRTSFIALDVGHTVAQFCRRSSSISPQFSFPWADALLEV